MKQKRDNAKPPWYRARNYKGNLTEDEKRKLDALRAQKPHPCATTADLPEEVQRYLSNVELEAYDLKQDRLAGRMLLGCLTGVGLISLNYFGRIGTLVLTNPSWWGMVFGGVVIVASLVWYKRQWDRNAADLFNPSERILQEWELDQVVRWRRPPDDDDDIL